MPARPSRMPGQHVLKLPVEHDDNFGSSLLPAFRPIFQPVVQLARSMRVEEGEEED